MSTAAEEWPQFQATIQSIEPEGLSFEELGMLNAQSLELIPEDTPVVLESPGIVSYEGRCEQVDRYRTEEQIMVFGLFRGIMRYRSLQLDPSTNDFIQRSKLFYHIVDRSETSGDLVPIESGPPERLEDLMEESPALMKLRGILEDDDPDILEIAKVFDTAIRPDLVGVGSMYLACKRLPYELCKSVRAAVRMDMGNRNTGWVYQMFYDFPVSPNHVFDIRTYGGQPGPAIIVGAGLANEPDDEAVFSTHVPLRQIAGYERHPTPQF